MSTLRELESRLWAAANSLRGPVDPADFKTYVFPLLFFKWVSDRWDLDSFWASRDDVPPQSRAEYHRFVVPEGCHWSDLRKVSVNVGNALGEILERIEKANPTTLAGIFGYMAWGSQEGLPEDSLLNLIDAFDKITLHLGAVSKDMLGAVSEYLLRQLADASGGEFFTPWAVVRLLVRILNPQPGEFVYDPACGSGGMLVETINEVREAGEDPRTLRLYGQEVNRTNADTARMNLFFHDVEDFRIVRGDTLRDPRFLQGSALRTFDIVVANPPFSLKNWGADTWSNDPYGRAVCGVPPDGCADFAWVQHMVASMKPESGRLGVVMPHGVLFRGGTEKTIRRCLVERDLLETVIGLPPELFYSTSIPTCLLIFRTTKPPARKGTVRFIDGSRCFEKAGDQNQLRPADVDALVDAYFGRSTAGTLAEARVVDLAEMKENRWDLTIGHYVKPVSPEAITVKEALDHFTKAQTDLREAEAVLAEQLREAGYA